MIRNVTLAFDESSERGWQLLIDHEFHAALSTTWSA